MLIRFITKNYLSFNEEVEFSMIPGKSKKHPHHVIKNSKRNDINVLKAGVIYGANASGKSNLIKAMAFARRLIIRGTKPKKLISLNRFKLAKNCLEEPAKFEFEFKHKGKNYAYGFELGIHKIHNEWLYEINKTSEKMIFERITKDDETFVKFGNVNFKNKKEEQFIQFTAMGTRPNQLFLTESIERGVKHFEVPYSWFDEKLTFIFPDTRFEGLELTIEEDKEFTNLLLKFLQLFNTGISDVVLKKVDIQSTLGDLPERIISDLLDKLEVGDKAVLSAPNDRRYLIHKDQNNELQVSKVMTKHKMFGCDDEALLEVAEESDGTQRLIDLIPALIQLLKMDRVFIVDELDRSLHPKLSRTILELFLNNKRQQKSQLIVTTHESSLLNLNLLRRDEIWFVEKDDRGISSIYSLEEFTPRYDKDVRKGYLLGRFGAIPIVHSVADLGWVD